MSDKLVVPRRRVRKNWYEGLNLDPVDRSHPDVDDQQLVQEAAEMNSLRELLSLYVDSLFFFSSV